MKVAVIGGGLAGLAVAWYLCMQGVQVVIFDPVGVGGGASGVAAGLMHPYPGAQARRSWQAEAGYRESLSLLSVAEGCLGRPVYTRSGILRRAIHEDQKRTLLLHAQAYGDVRHIGGDLFHLTTGVTVDILTYLVGLLGACRNQGAHLVHAKVTCLEELGGFDQIVIAAGSGSSALLPLGAVSATQIKGQSLLCRNPSMDTSCIAQGYIGIGPNALDIAHVGATYERQFSHPDPCLKTAKALLSPHWKQWFLDGKDPEILDCRAGVRLMRCGTYVPYTERIRQGIWFFGALGSRGLLYHAYLGRILAEAVAFDVPVRLPV